MDILNIIIGKNLVSLVFLVVAAVPPIFLGCALAARHFLLYVVGTPP